MQVKTEASVGELLSTLARGTGTLVRREVELASTELAGKARGAATHVAMLGAGGVFVLAGLVALMTAAVLGLAPFVPMWASALGIGGVALVVGGVLLTRGARALLDFDPVPRETVKTLQDDVVWAKEQLQ